MNNLHDLIGERKNQLLITVNKQGKPIGTATRAACHAGEGIPHLAFMALVMDRAKNIILTKRGEKKSLWAGFWDASVVSHVLPGETVGIAANRRGREELGIDVEFTSLGAFYYFAKHGENAENEYCHVLVGTTNEDIHPNPVEIDAVKKMRLADLLKVKKERPESLAPWFIFALRKFDFSSLS